MTRAITPHNPLEGEKPDLTIPLHSSSEEQISIIIVHKDRPSYLNIALQSIAITSINNNYEIIVVDNGSGKETQDFLDEIQDQVKVIRNEDNKYWSYAANQGVKAADKNSKYYIFLHPDVVILNPAWMDLLINISEGQGSGLVGVSMNAYSMGGDKVQFIEEHCMLVTKECWEESGPFPEELPIIGHSFILTLSAQAKGYHPQMVKNSLIHHYKMFSLDYSTWEVFQEQAQVTIPKLMQNIKRR